MKASILDLRLRMKEIMKALERHESVTLTHRGKPKALITPFPKIESKKKVSEHEAFGMWADREDMKDVDAYIRSLRRSRYRDL